MSEKKIISLPYKEQKAIKPKIEDLIPNHLDGDMKESALDFIAFLRKNKMAPDGRSPTRGRRAKRAKPFAASNYAPTLIFQARMWRGTPFWPASTNTPGMSLRICITRTNTKRRS